MLGKTLRYAFVLMLGLSQAAQGVFAGAILCHEETGSVAVEWSDDGRCESPNANLAPCLTGEAPASAHCGPCLDVPVPSETSLKSASTGASLPALAEASFARLSMPRAASSWTEPRAPRREAVEPLRTVRLLI